MSELKVRVDELTVELDAETRELRATQLDLQKTTALYEKTVEEKEILERENQQLNGKLPCACISFLPLNFKKLK